MTMTGVRIAAPALAVLAAMGAAQPPPAARTGLIVGQVVDAGSGRPIGGAIVMLGGVPTGPGSTGQPRPQLPGILTGSDGRFVFSGLPRGSFNITAVRAGYAQGAYGRRRPNGPPHQIALEEGERAGEVVIRMWKYAAISGTVVDEAGEPLVGVHVRVLRRTMVPSRRRFVAAGGAPTDDRGIYRVAHLIPGEYIVAASTRQVAVPLSVAQESQASGTAAGSMIFEAGGSTALPGTSTALQAGNAVYPVGRGAPIPPPPSGGRLLIYPATFHPSADSAAQAATLTVAAGEERAAIDLQLHPVPTVRVSGTVIGPDAAGGSIPVRLRPAGNDDIGLEEDWPVAMADHTGAFTFPAVPAGEYTLRAVSRGQPTHWAEVPVVAGRSDIAGLTVTLQPGLRISGRVEFDGRRDRPDASRLGQVPVVIEPVDSTWDAGGRRAHPITLASTGEFMTPGFPAGRYFVRVGGSPVGWMFRSAMHNGRDLSETPLELHGADATGIVITFTDRWSGMSGVVRPADGSTAADVDATVLVFPTDRHRWTDLGLLPRRIRSVPTRKGGEFSVTSLPPGDYYVVAVPDQLGSDWQDPPLMETLARLATRVTIGDGAHRTVDLRVVEAR